MMKEFDGDFRVYRVVMASNNPIDTLHKLRSGAYSVITFFNMLEMLEVQRTIEEDINYQRKVSK